MLEAAPLQHTCDENETAPQRPPPPRLRHSRRFASAFVKYGGRRPPMPPPPQRGGGQACSFSRRAGAPSFVCLLPQEEGGRSADRRIQPCSAPAVGQGRAPFSLPSPACGGGLGGGRARLSALHRGSRLGDRTPPLSLGPRFLESPGANGLPPSPGQCSKLLADRSSCRPGGAPKPPGSGLRIRAQAPHSLRNQDRLMSAPRGERDSPLVT